MSAFKIRHILTGKFVTTTALTRYSHLYFSGIYFPLEKALIKDGGRVYTTRKEAEGGLKKTRLFKNEFEIIELK